MKIRILLNGKKAQLAPLRLAIDTLREQHDIEVRVTYEAGDMARLVDEAIGDNCQRLVAAGGDGTVNEVVDALLTHPKASRPALAILPLGTANDFAAACAIPDEPEAALELALSADAFWVDAIKANDTHLINIASGGFGAQVTSTTPAALKNFLGGGAYTLSGLIQALSFKPYEGEFIIDGQSASQQLLLGAVCNGRQAGGGQVLAPNAYINDGLLDLVALHDFPLEALSQVIDEFRQPKDDNQYAIYAQNTAARWRAKSPMPINLDGEPITTSDITFEVVPNAIKMVLGADCPMLKPGSEPA